MWVSLATVEDAVRNCVAVESRLVNIKCLFNTGSLLKERHCLAGCSVVSVQARACNVVE